MSLLTDIENVYFLGIGGIGMSALARYFKAYGKRVYGYDRTATPLTDTLESEGMLIHYTDDPQLISPACRQPDRTIVVYTPAIPVDHKEKAWFASHGFRLLKRAQVLGEISRAKKTIGVAGTHGKTTISTMTAHLFTQTGIGCDAFLGGISKNYGTNLLLLPGSRYVVAEADEFDRSMLQLTPYVAVISAADADHLDIYQTHEAVKEAFAQYAAQIQPDGFLLIKQTADVRCPSHVPVYRYALQDAHADFHARHIAIRDGRYHFDLVTPDRTIPDLTLGVPGLVNVENAVAALAVTSMHCQDDDRIRQALQSFTGVQRRFDYHIRTDRLVYIDDYGHHPEELRFTIESVRALYPGRHITGIFQPHLYSRTRDFAPEFAKSLSALDKVILLDIYPAREAPIPGVTSEIILQQITCPDKMLCPMDRIMDYLAGFTPDILLTMGAGNIDRLIGPITELYSRNA